MKKRNSRFYFDEMFKIPKSKRSQISIFIIIALVVVGGVGTFYFMTRGGDSNLENKFFSEAGDRPELNQIKESIIGCRDSSVRDSLDLIGVQGGFFEKPESYFDMEWTFIPYYYKEGAFLMPEKTKIEEELGKAIDKSFSDCVSNLSFDKFQLDQSSPKTKATIKPKTVGSNIDMKINIKGDNVSTSIDMKQAPLNVNVSLYEILEIAKYITDSHKEDPDFMCVTCIADMAETRDLYVDSFDIGDNSVLFIISENKSSEIYAFEFLNKYVPMKVQTSNVPISPKAG